MTDTTQRDVALVRSIDPQRGPFDPRQLQPPNGVRHIDKTRQDKMPTGIRPRVQEAQARAQKMSQ